MKTIKAKVEIEIYDDPEFCGECIITDICDYLLNGNCVKFIDKDQPRRTDTFAKKRFISLELDMEKDMYKKCDQCKVVYQKAKLEGPTDNICIDGHRFNCEKTQIWYGNGTNGKAILLVDDIDRMEFIKRCREPEPLPISTHEGFINKTGVVLAVAQYRQHSEKMSIEIVITGIQ